MPIEPFPPRAAVRCALALLLAAALAPAVRAGVNVWTPIGPDGGPVFDLRIDPAAPATLYAGTLGGVFKSLDGGASWALASRGLGGSQIYVLNQDPRQPGHLFATTTYGQVFRSLDGAATWQALPGAPAGGIDSLVADLASPRGLLASADGSVWQSADGGTTWEKRSDRRIFGLALLADPRHPGTLYTSSTVQNGPDVLYSTDGGATWSPRNNGLPELEDGGGGIQIALDPEVPTTLYAVIRRASGEPARPFVSRDAGASWQPGNVGGFPLATGPGGAVYAGYARSLDHGSTWTGVTALPEGFALTVSPVSATTVYANTPSGLYASADGADSWQPIVHGLAATSITALAVRPGLPTFVLAGVDKIGVFRSRPAGQNWRLGVSVPYGGPPQILFDPADPAVAYTEAAQKILRSTDAGLTWEETTQPPVNPRCSPSLRTLATGPGAFYAGFNLDAQTTCAQACGIWKSVDQGQSWTCLSLKAPGVRSLAVSPSSGGAVVYATEAANLWKSADGGKTWALQNRGWQRVTTALDLVAVDPTRADTLYLTSADGLLKSTDGARTFTAAGRGLPTPTVFISAVLVDPTNPNTLYVGEALQGVYRSTDGGRRWFPQVGGLHGFSGALALDPLHPSTLYAGTPGNGVYTITFAP